MMTTYTAGRRPHCTAYPITVWRADIHVSTPAAGGGDYVIYVHCRHAHETRESAERCAIRLANYIERRSACPSWADDSGHIAQRREEQS